MDRADSSALPLSEAERARRQEAVDYARSSVWLEGFVLSPEVEELNRRYVIGEITSAEHSEAIRHLYAA